MNVKLACSVFVWCGLLSGCGGSGGSSNGLVSNGAKVTCSNFATQSQAQQYYLDNPSATHLDADNDGKACEHLPGIKSASMQENTALFVGSYTLLGNSCEVSDVHCRPQLVTLNIESERDFSMCFHQDMEQVCNWDKKIIIELIDHNMNGLEFVNAEINFVDSTTGHMVLTYQGIEFYGQNSLHTDWSINGIYNNDGVLFEADGSYSIRSHYNQVIRWNEHKGLSVTHH